MSAKPTNDLAERLHRLTFKRSGRANAKCNQSAAWQRGFKAGANAPSSEGIGNGVWMAEFSRLERNEITSDDWREWKMGWHTARMQKAVAKAHSEAVS